VRQADCGRELKLFASQHSKDDWRRLGLAQVLQPGGKVSLFVVELDVDLAEVVLNKL
jgi:hypothetical protein